MLDGVDTFFDQCWNDMRARRIEVIAWTIEVHRQQKDAVVAILLAVSLTLDQEHLFGQAIRGVGFLWVAVPETLFLEGHRGVLRVGTYRADGDKLAHARPPG